ncbi:MAG: hypothetical protein FWD63_05655 [Propionibacteriaceae bacterium]|nr:hypothetical protein [Propionibacteriaceae bacterium]
MRETLEADNPKDAADALRYLRNAINSPHQPLTGDIRWQHLADIATWATIAAALTKQETEQ